MNAYDTSGLFDYLRGIYGRQFTQKDSDMRTWLKQLEPHPVELVIRAVDKHVQASNDDFPPNLSQLVKLCKTIKSNVTMLHPVDNTPRLEKKTTWQQWSVCMAEKLLAIYEWEQQPQVDVAGIMGKAAKMKMSIRDQMDWSVDEITKARQATPEFKDLAQQILNRVPEYFAEYDMASDVSQKERDVVSYHIFRDLGAKAAKKVELFKPVTG